MKAAITEEQFHDLLGGCPRSEDDPEMRRLRKKAEGALKKVIQQVKSKYTLSLPVELLICEDEEDSTQVSIVIESFKDDPENDDKAGIDFFVIDCTFEWISLSTPKQIQAVFAHELGHAVLGHLEEETNRYFTPMWTFIMVVCHGAFLSTLILHFISQHSFGYTSQVITAFVAIVSLGRLWFCLPSLARSRQAELEADWFAAQLNYSKPLMEDIGRGVNWLSEFKHSLFVFVSTHPTFNQRCKNLNLEAKLK
jgi:hypothetical protein